MNPLITVIVRTTTTALTRNMPDDRIERITFVYEPDREFIGFRFYSTIKEEDLKKRLGLTDDDPESIENKIAFFFGDRAFPGLSGITNQWAYAEYRLPEGFPSDYEFPFATFPRRAPWDFTDGREKSVEGATLTLKSDQPTFTGLFTYEYNLWDAKVTNLESVLLLEDTAFPTGVQFKEFPTRFRTFLEAYAQNSRTSNCSTYANERYRLAENTGFTVDLSEINIQARIIEPFADLSEQETILPCNCCGRLDKRIDDLATSVAQIAVDQDDLKKRVDDVSAAVVEVDTRVDKLSEKVKKVDKRGRKTAKKVRRLDKRVVCLEKRFKGVRPVLIGLAVLAPFCALLH